MKFKNKQVGFKCIKTMFDEKIDNEYGEYNGLQYPFIEGRTYKVNKGSDRVVLFLECEHHKRAYCVAHHWLHWKFDQSWKEHFVKIYE